MMDPDTMQSVFCFEVIYSNYSGTMYSRVVNRITSFQSKHKPVRLYSTFRSLSDAPIFCPYYFTFQFLAFTFDLQEKKWPSMLYEIYLRLEFYRFFSLAFMFNGDSSCAITIHPIDTKICILARCPNGHRLRFY